MRQRRIGLLGGSFDPPHLGHLALGRCAIETLHLDELRWLPAGAPWQKAGRLVARPVQRAAMLAALIGNEPRCVVDARELHRSGPSYTIDSVRELQSEQPDADWFLVLGQDQYARLDTWSDWRELLARLTLAVAGRAGQPPAAPPALAGVPHRMIELALPRLDIAASDIRDRLGRGENVAPLVGAAVARYIDHHAPYPGRIRS